MKNLGAILIAFFIMTSPTQICAGWLDEYISDSSAASETDSKELMDTDSKDEASDDELFLQIVSMVQGVDMESENMNTLGRSDCANLSHKCKEPENVAESK